MTDIVLNPVKAGYNLSIINDNFDKIEEVVNEQVLHSTGGNNTMNQPIDMNNQKLLNLPVPQDPLDVVRYADLLEAVGSVNGSQAIQPRISPRQLGDGSTLIFSSPASKLVSANSIQVHINGVWQRPITDFSITNLGEVLFVTAPSLNDIIDIVWYEPILIELNPGYVLTAESGNAQTVQTWINTIDKVADQSGNIDLGSF